MNIKYILTFVGGTAVGLIAGVFCTKNYFEKKANERADSEIDEMQEYYNRKAKELTAFFEKDEQDENGTPVGLNGEPDDNAKYYYGQPRVVNLSDDGSTSYDKMYKPGHKVLHKTMLSEEEMAEAEHPEDDDEEVDEDGFVREYCAPTSPEERDRELAEEATNDHNENFGRKPRIISEDSLGEVPAYVDHKILLYYTENDALVDEQDSLIDDPEYLVGDSLDKYDFRNSDEEVIFVRNFDLDAVYEIQKIDGAFGED